MTSSPEDRNPRLKVSAKPGTAHSFRRRGLSAVRSEWAFIHLAANMLKLYQHHSAAAHT